MLISGPIMIRLGWTKRTISLTQHKISTVILKDSFGKCFILEILYIWIDVLKVEVKYRADHWANTI